MLTHPSNCDLITGLVLSGGRATRMNNLDKGLQRLHGQRLIDLVLTRLRPQIGTILINANRHIEEYAQTGHKVVADVRSDYPGPLAGLEAGLLHCHTPYLLVVPCDAPFLPADLASRLLHALEQQQAEIAIACSGSAISPQLQPVFCLLKSNHLPLLQAYLNLGGRKMAGWFGDLPMTQVFFPDERAFTNLNTMQDLQTFQDQ